VSALVELQRELEQEQQQLNTTGDQATHGDRGVTALTVTHELTPSPGVAAMVAGAAEGAGGGWAEVLSDLKSLLETGEPLRRCDRAALRH
jgi:hypothetical protein